LIPGGALLDAGRHYLRLQQRSLGVSEPELIKIAVKSLGLEEQSPFKPEERIIEYRLREAGARPLVRMSVQGFVDETASESPAPGGGSVAALLGALGGSLGTMVANLSAHKRGWDDRWEEFSRWAERGQALKDELLALVDDDTQAFNRVMSALGMPKSTVEEKARRKALLVEANQGAVAVPLRVMKVSLELFPLLEAMARDGNPASVSDAGVGALAARAAVRGAGLNVRTNLSGLGDGVEAARLGAEVAGLLAQAEAGETKVLDLVERALAKS
jgi:glutamate formiminotransferase/formiminotetrahydrofolate cyclodeaminase